MSKYSKFKFGKYSEKADEGHLFDSNDSLNEADNDEEVETSSGAGSDNTKTEDQLRIEACKLSQKISKLMNNVTPADMLEIADACLKYIKYQKAGEDYDPTFGLDDAENSSSSDEESSSESEENEEKKTDEDNLSDEDFELGDDKEDTSENGAMKFDDLDFDFDDENEEEPKKTEKKEDEDILPDEFII